ncbi:MAG: helix-turn-helix transcriptional regulator [Lachnospiraceae bacterium]|nr:helix-turn-helix transcriptional regulator [Lachnospiraceae bacterium]
MATSGDRIREMRLRQKLTLDDVAKYLNVNRQAIYKYEHGVVTNIPLENLEKMAELFCTTPGYLAGWTDATSPSSAFAVSSTPEARIISEGIDKMPKERREQALRIMQAAFAEYSEYFKEDHTDDA